MVPLITQLKSLYVVCLAFAFEVIFCVLQVSADAFSDDVVIEVFGCVGTGAVCNAVAARDENGSSVVEFKFLCDKSSIFGCLRCRDLFEA